MLLIRELKWSGINGCGSADSARVRRERLLLIGNSGGTEDSAGILGTARGRRPVEAAGMQKTHMALRSLDKVRAPNRQTNYNILVPTVKDKL